jgi:hypothetical protein
MAYPDGTGPGVNPGQPPEEDSTTGDEGGTGHYGQQSGSDADEGRATHDDHARQPDVDDAGAQR